MQLNEINNNLCYLKPRDLETTAEWHECVLLMHVQHLHVYTFSGTSLKREQPLRPPSVDLTTQ